jgi:hypothetical protein
MAFLRMTWGPSAIGEDLNYAFMGGECNFSHVFCSSPAWKRDYNVGPAFSKHFFIPCWPSATPQCLPVSLEDYCVN